MPTGKRVNVYITILSSTPLAVAISPKGGESHNSTVVHFIRSFPSWKLLRLQRI